MCISTLLAKLYNASHTKLRERALGKLTVQIRGICQVIPYTLQGKITACPKHRKKNLFQNCFDFWNSNAPGKSPHNIRTAKLKNNGILMGRKILTKQNLYMRCFHVGF